jgi:di/tricarboxylate transporter
MDLAWISLAALIVVIVVSCTTAVNPGLLSIAFAWVIGVYIAPEELGLKKVVAGFPQELFLTLVGTTLLFTQAQVNGTLEKVSRVAVGCCRGNAGLIPIMFFLLAFGLATVGGGNIASSALIAPMAMAAAQRAAIPPFLMTIMVAHGAIAGAVSPFAPTGIIANNLMRTDLGLSGTETAVFGYNAAANAIVALGGYFLFGGWKLFWRSAQPADAATADNCSANIAAPRVEPEPGLEPRHWWTLCVIGGLVAGVIFGGWHIGMAAVAGAILLIVTRTADEQQAIRAMPWSVIVMVCGVTVLTALLEKTGGIDRFAWIVGRVASERSVMAVIALATGLVSVYSSTSGVVLPAFLPMVPKLVSELGGGDPLKIALSMVVGGHLVDASPLSTIGALCIASAPVTSDRQLLFTKVLAWGLSMSLVGAGLCQLLFS